MKDWITLPKTEGIASRQAHADLPDGTYERELGRAGFTGPATHMYPHRQERASSACAHRCQRRDTWSSAR